MSSILYKVNDQYCYLTFNGPTFSHQHGLETLESFSLNITLSPTSAEVLLVSSFHLHCNFFLKIYFKRDTERAPAYMGADSLLSTYPDQAGLDPMRS